MKTTTSQTNNNWTMNLACRESTYRDGHREVYLLVILRIANSWSLDDASVVVNVTISNRLRIILLRIALFFLRTFIPDARFICVESSRWAAFPAHW